jgi:hypothetical protein
VTGPLSFEQVRHLLTLACEAVNTATATGHAIGGEGPAWLEAFAASSEAIDALVAAIVNLQSGAAPEGASCETCGSLQVFVHGEPGDTSVLCRACLPEDGAS